MCALAVLATLAPAGTAVAETTLDPANPTANFTKEGGEDFTPGADFLRLIDDNPGDYVLFYAPDSDASAGTELDVVTTFQVQQEIRVGANVGNRAVIDDGVARSAIAATIVKDNVKGIGLYAGGDPSIEASYPVFVPVDWQAAPVTIRLRRYANGDAELVEVNGVAPSPRAFLPAAMVPGPTRFGFPSVEFGAASLAASVTVDYFAFRSERVVNPVAGTLQFTSLRLGDSDSGDRLALRGDYTLGAAGGGIDPASEPVTIRLSTPAGGQFYPSAGVNPLNGFDVKGSAPRRRWTLNDGERARTGIEQLVFDEDASNGGGVSLRDRRATLATGDYSTVQVEITIGTGATADKLTGTASLVETPEGSGHWRLQE